MSEVKEEYTRETYPSFGKKYNGEKAIISMTSWKMRIATCSKTIYSLLKQCPGFHIVLVLSEEEFPKMMDELPENLKLFVDNELIELMFVWKNYKSFKKVLFTMDKYRDVPVISADDDCIYTCNYAQELYDMWMKTDKNTIIAGYKNFVFNELYLPNGCCSLFSPNVFKDLGIKLLNTKILNTNNDDMYLGYLIKKLNMQIVYLNKNYIEMKLIEFHDEIEAMGATGKYSRGIDVLNILKNEIQTIDNISK